MSCIAVSAFHLSCVQHQHQQVDMAAVCSTPDPSDLVSISQSRCSPSDLLRMQRILADKLGLAIPKNNNEDFRPDPPPVTPLSLLRLMFAASKAASVRLGLPDLLPATLPDNLVHKLEILVCDSQTLSHR